MSVEEQGSTEQMQVDPESQSQIDQQSGTDLNEWVKNAGNLLKEAKEEIAKMVVGQQNLVDSLFIGLLTNSHVLLEGVPGLAKTTTVKTLAKVFQAQFHRVQFTPDLLPADVIGSLVYNPKTAEYYTRFGPVFCNVLLADEINRAAPKVQSSLLEAMEEHQVTIGDQSYPLPDPFLVLATENPVEQEGTYPLPEAQLDRFMLKVFVNYPTEKEEMRILNYIADGQAKEKLDPILTIDDVNRMRDVVKLITVKDSLKEYIVKLVMASRHPETVNEELSQLVRFGCSPRATINLTKAARAHAFQRGRTYVVPEDIKTVAPAIMGHRILVTYEAEAEDIDSYQIVDKLLEAVEVP